MFFSWTFHVNSAIPTSGRIMKRIRNRGWSCKEKRWLYLQEAAPETYKGNSIQSWNVRLTAIEIDFGVKPLLYILFTKIPMYYYYYYFFLLFFMWWQCRITDILICGVYVSLIHMHKCSFTARNGWYNF